MTTSGVVTATAQRQGRYKTAREASVKKFLDQCSTIENTTVLNRQVESF